MIEIKDVEITPNPIYTNKTYIISITIEETLDYPYNYPYDYPILSKQ